MDNKSNNDVDFEPQWPQRPNRPRPEVARPRLDPPDEPNNSKMGSGGFGDTDIQPSKWTSHPTFYAKQPGMTPASPSPATPSTSSRPAPNTNSPTSSVAAKDTVALPIVESSRFSNGRVQQAPGQGSPTPVPSASARVSQRPQVQPQDQARRPKSGVQPQAIQPAQVRPLQRNMPAQDLAPTLPYVPVGQDPSQYEDYDEYAAGGLDTGSNPHGGYDDATMLYNPVKAGRRAVPPAGQRRVGASVSAAGKAATEVKPKRKPRWRWLVWTFTTLVGILAIIAVAFSLAWQGQYAGKIYSGVQVLGIDMGNKTPADARKLLDDKVQAFLAQPIVLTWGGKEWRPTADQIGLKIDTEGTANAAYNVGRGTDFFANVQEQWSSSQVGYSVPLNIQFSEPTLQQYLQGIAASDIDQKLFEGDVRLNGAEVVALPGKEGRTLSIYSTIVAVRQSLAALQPGTKIAMPVDTVEPVVSADEVGVVQNLLAVRVSGPITATVPGKTFTLDREAIVRFTTIERSPDRTASKHVTLGWRDNELKTLAANWAKEASRPPQNAKFSWQNNQLSVVSESIDGMQVDTDTVMASIKEHADTTEKREYELPAKVLTPKVSSKDLGALGIKELMGSGLSTFVGSSPERAKNITVAANLLNGTVVPPGGTFSFLDAMGGIDEAHGFVPGYVIAAERTQLGVGGGVCQVSTTTFRAAFWAGLQITERNQHSYRVGWYEANGEPVGFDAAVFDPGVDLKFVNTTANYILVQATAGADSLTVNVFGTKVPGTVKLEGPVITNKVAPPPDVYEVDSRLPAGTKKQVETAHGGLDTLITRRIITPGQPDKTDQFHSSYKAWPNWYIVASPSQIPGGAQTPHPTATP